MLGQPCSVLISSASSAFSFFLSFFLFSVPSVTLWQSFFFLRGNHRNQAVDVLNCIVEVRRNANFPFAEADEHFLFAELVVKLGGFFWSARDEAAVGAAKFSVEGTGGDAAVDRQTGKHEIDELVIVRENGFRFCAEDEFDGGVERGEIEIEV